MLSGNCTEALPVQAKVTISGSSAKLIKNGIAPLPFLPALLKQYWYPKRGERVRVRGHAPFYGTLRLIQRLLVAQAANSPSIVRLAPVTNAASGLAILAKNQTKGHSKKTFTKCPQRPNDQRSLYEFVGCSRVKSISLSLWFLFRCCRVILTKRDLG